LTGTNNDSMKKSFNVDSPSFTPSFLSATENVNANGKKSTGISPKAANAAPFLPKSAAVSSKLVSQLCCEIYHTQADCLDHGRNRYIDTRMDNGRPRVYPSKL
jgi:hypothetical protein